jgi:hypothetical protein
MQSIWGPTSIFITENGCAASDVVADDRLYETDRITAKPSPGSEDTNPSERASQQALVKGTLRKPRQGRARPRVATRR